MKLFAGYGYNARDQWIEDLVFPLAEAMECEVLHGRIVYGGALSSEVLGVIRRSDAMIGFTTRRDELRPGQFSTHPWVIHELVAAHSQDPPIPFVEVRETGVEPGGVIEAVNAQRINYQEDQRDRCLVEIAAAIKRLRGLTSLTTIRLGPDAVTSSLGDSIEHPSLVCRYQTLRDTVSSEWRQIPILPINGSLFVKPRGLAAGELVRIEVSVAGRRWISTFESVDTVDIQLRSRTD